MSWIPPGRRRLLRGAVAAVLLTALPNAASAGLEAFRTSRHGDPVSGPLRDRKYRPGTCLQCHGSSRDSSVGGSANRMALFAANDDQLCLTCHKAARGSFPGPSLVTRSTHSRSSLVVWPGPVPKQRPRGDGGLCLNCHDPHGRTDALGPIPAMLVARGDDLCLACHRGGGGGSDISSELNEISRHPRLGGGAGMGATLQGTVCVDCHNPHLARRDSTGTQVGTAGLMDGVRRVRPVNGAPGSLPRLVPVGPEDRSPTQEYEVCFRCHAGATGAAAGLAAPTGAGLLPPTGAGLVPATGASAAVARGEVASVLNPANASYHPVEAPGRDGAIDQAAFVSGWRSGQMVTCSDCHGSGSGRVRGPHGSSFPKLLKKRYPVAAPTAQPEPSDLCLDCHAWGAYAAAGAGRVATASRYGGHASHAGQGLSCHACHEPHGSPKLPSLLAIRSPGLVTYQRDASGGTCTVSCHAKTPPTASYRLAYPR